jgi:hypothetical protein
MRSFTGGEWHAQADVLALEPGGANAEDGTTAREHVQRGHLLDEDARVAIGDARDHGSEAHACGRRGQKAQACVGLEHGLVDVPNTWNLEKMIHQPDRFESDRLCELAYFSQAWTDRGAGPSEAWDP